jgi:CubicO group peptidase (beta-lactamase class C family)
VEATSLFRLASISKTLTGVAILRLVEDKAISLSDKLLDLIDMPGTISDDGVGDIEVQHLLHHVGGWDKDSKTGSGVDPMVRDAEIAGDYDVDLPITQQMIIRWVNEHYADYCVRKGRTLDFDPGTVDGYAYSNYGYMLLGQIIESVAGVPYEDFIRERLLVPLGIYRMRLGRTLLRSKLSDEVLYHANGHFGVYPNVMMTGSPKNTMLPYGGYFSMENMAAHGGWLGTAIDLVRYASTFDDPACPILSASSIQKLFARHPYVSNGKTAYYGCGWYVRTTGASQGESHGGGFSGTATIVDRWRGGNGETFAAALLFNKDDGGQTWDLLSLIRNAYLSIAAWPATGFWSDYF